MSTTGTGKQCRLYAKGHCRFGASCKFSHELASQTEGKSASQPQHNDPSQSQSIQTPAAECSKSAVTRPKRGEIPCRAWKTGSCLKGDKCWFGHDPEVQAVYRRRQEEQAERVRQQAARRDELARQAEQRRIAQERALEEQERARQALLAAQKAAQRAKEEEQRVRLAELAKEEAAKIVQHVVLGSIVTFGAGLEIQSLITGFDCCTVCIKNLPADAQKDEVCALFTQQGINATRFQFVSMKSSAQGKQEATIVIDAESGQVLAAGLEDIDFRDEKLSFEVGTYNSPGGMGEAAGRDASVLTISFRAPSARYVAEYQDISIATHKQRELDRSVHSSRRIKVEMNTPPPGRIIPSFKLCSIKIYNLPQTITDIDVKAFTGSNQVRRLNGTTYDVDAGIRQLRRHVEAHSGGTLRSFEPSPMNLDGIINISAQFTSWEEAQRIHQYLTEQKPWYLGNTKFWLRLPSPMLFTITLPIDQYQAQITQWNSLTESISDKKACNLLIKTHGRVVTIQVAGSVKPAVGALKVRVEHLAAGEVIQNWHRSFIRTSQGSLIHKIHHDTAAYIRADWRRQVLLVYGEPKAVERAREMVKVELDRLADMEWTVNLKPQSVGYFIRHGVAVLKEMIGEDNIKLNASTRKITIVGDEEARRTLGRLIDESLSGHHALLVGPSAKHTCPICFDDVSGPFHLGCGHVYCTACLRHFLISALDSNKFPLVCMGDESRCGTPIPIPTIEKFLPLASFNRLLEIAFVAYTAERPKELCYCTTPDCIQIYRSTDSPKSLRCPSCFSTVCSSCQEEAHDGCTCAEARLHRDPAEQERLNEQWISQQGGRVRKCPECKRLIEKTEGCNHMTCPCGAHICWQCMGVFPRDSIYEHMHTQHGGIYNETPVAIHDVDYQEQEEVLRQARLQRQQEERPQRLVAPALGHQRQNLLHVEGQNWNQIQQARLQRLRERQERELRLREEQARQLLQARQERLRDEREREYQTFREAQARQQARQERLRLEEQRRREGEQKGSGWGCTIM